MQVDGTCTANSRILRNRLRLSTREALGSTSTSRILGWKRSAERLIGIGASTDRQGPLPHHPACGSAPGGSGS